MFDHARESFRVLAALFNPKVRICRDCAGVFPKNNVYNGQCLDCYHKPVNKLC